MLIIKYFDHVIQIYLNILCVDHTCVYIIMYVNVLIMYIHVAYKNM
jgi:hypothetical protein